MLKQLIGSDTENQLYIHQYIITGGVAAQYEHYAHDEWFIRDLLHWQNYPSIPITFPCFQSRGV
jgi:hypothetical protein